MSDAEELLAQKLHESYERLAPNFGYKTRDASAVPWKDVPEQNKRLMIAVCTEICGSHHALYEALEGMAQLRASIRTWGLANRIPGWQSKDALFEAAERALAQARGEAL
jgi:hypothetical protein